MATSYTIGNVRTQRKAVAAVLGALFSHLDGMDIDITAISLAGNGTITVTLSRDLTADERGHLGA